MKTQILAILFLISGASIAQVADNFDDSDLLVSPKWTGQLNFFSTQDKKLRSTNSNTNAVFYISTPSSASVNAEWRIDITLLFNTSSANYVDWVVMSDSSDVTKMKNGYFVRLGGTQDEIALYKTKNGTETKIIDGTDNVLNSSNNQWMISLTRLFSGNFILKRQLTSGSTMIQEGIAGDSDIATSSYCGIRIRQSTSSFFNKHFFDNFYAGKIVRDTIPPYLDSLVIINDKKLHCTFNEACDSSSMSDIKSYKILQGNLNPLASLVLDSKTVVIEFQNGFTPNTISNLLIENIKDMTGNKIISASRAFYYSKPDMPSFHDLLITELMPDPDPVVGLPNKEYVEITNISGKFIQLKGCKIHDPTNENDLPDMVLAPDSVVLLTQFPSLNNTGDRIWLTNQKGEILHFVSYSDAWYRDELKKNGGWSLEMIDVYNLCAGAINWRASLHPKGGTPGAVNSVKGTAPSDNIAPVIVSVFPVNDSIIRLVFNEEIDSINSIMASFSVNGLTAHIKQLKMSVDFKGYDLLIDFKPHSDSIYRIIISDIKDCSGNSGNLQFSLQWPSESKRNGLIFNEILFNPKTGGNDFIEMHNNTSRAFDLSKHFIAVLDENNQYKSMDKLSEMPLFIGPHQYLLLSADTAKVCKEYICGNSGTLKLNFNKMPSMPDDGGNLLLINSEGQTIDSLTYSENWHFPLLSDKEGVSLERISFTSPTSSIYSWHSAASIAGFATPGYLNSQTSILKHSNQYFSLQNKSVSPDEDGFEDALILNYNLPKPDYTANISIYDTEGRLIKQWINNETLGTEGFVTWDGTDYNTQKAAIGMYILTIECTHIDGSKIRDKMSFTVAGKF